MTFEDLFTRILIRIRYIIKYQYLIKVVHLKFNPPEFQIYLIFYSNSLSLLVSWKKTEDGRPKTEEKKLSAFSLIPELTARFL